MPCAFSPVLFSRVFPLNSSGKRFTFSTFLTTDFFSQPTSYHNQLLLRSSHIQLSLTQITSAVTSSYTYIRLCNFMKFCLRVKTANANTLARALSVFGGSVLMFVCKSGSHRLVTQFVASAPVWPFIVLFSIFSIYPIIYVHFEISDYSLFIFEFLIIH